MDHRNPSSLREIIYKCPSPTVGGPNRPSLSLILCTMMVARREAAQVVMIIGFSITGTSLSDEKAYKALAMAKKLEPNQGQLVAAKVATGSWFKHPAFRGSFYSESEGVLWALCREAQS